MSFLLLDQISLPGDAAKPNEDAFAQGEDAALVMDGATPLGEPLMPGPSDAAWLSGFGARRLIAHLKAGDAPKQAITQALRDAEKSFAALARRPIREQWEMPCASLMLVTHAQARIPLARESAPEGEVPVAPPPVRRAEGVMELDFHWFGDCTALLLLEEACEIIGDAFDRREEEAKRARQVALEKNLKPAPDLNRPEILSLLRASRNRVNNGDEWLFSPDPRAAKHVRHKKHQARPGALLLIASDGFLALATDYGLYDARGLVMAAQAKGLAALGAELRGIENEDALGEKFARFKKSDDATALLLEVT